MARLGTYFFAALLAGAGLSAFGTGEARAAFTIKPDDGTPTVTPAGLYAFSYTASLAAGDTLNTGDFFRIYDLMGFNGVFKSPPGWTFSTALSNPVPPPNVILAHGDDPSIPNLIWTYTGPSGVINGPTAISGFSAQATAFTNVTKDFVGRVSQTGSTTLTNDSVGPIFYAAGSPFPAPVPEPSALISGGLGLTLLGLGYVRRSRRRSA